MNISLLYARSRALFICSFIFYYLICFVISCFPLDKYTKLPDGQFMLLLLGSQCVCVFIAYYVAQLTAYGRPEVEIMHDGINITWKKNFLLGRKPDRKILYSDIRSHERISGIRGGGYVLMGLADGSKMKLYEGLLLIGKVQGFQHFIDELFDAITLYRNQGKPIARQETPAPVARSFVAPVNNSGVVYHTKNSSNLGAFIGFFAILTVLMCFIVIVITIQVPAGPYENIEEGIIIFGGLAAVIFGMVWLLRKAIVQNIEVEVLSDRINVRYTRQPFFDRNQDRTILLNDIVSYKINAYRVKIFMLYLRDGTKFRASLGEFDKSQEFTMMTDAIIAMIEKRNISPATPLPIVRRKTIYEGTSGMVLLVFFSILILAVIIGIIFFPQQHESSDVFRGLGSAVIGLGFIAHILSQRKKKGKEGQGSGQ